MTTDKPSIHKTPVPQRNGQMNGRNGKAKKPAKDETRAITPMSLMHALRRRWIPAVAVAIPAALLAAVVIWEIIPAPYESYAVVKVNQYGENIIYQVGGRETNHLNFRDSQMAYIRSRGVLQAALRKPEVAQTETMKDMKYPVEFLSKNLKVDAMESDEFVRVALSGSRPRELATIVDAIKDSYMNEVVYKERNKKLSKLEKLKELLEKKTNELIAKQKDIDELAEGLGTVDARIANESIQMAQRNLQALFADYRAVKQDLREQETVRAARIEAGLPPDSLIPTTELQGGGQGAVGNQVNPAVAAAARKLQLVQEMIAKIEEATVPGSSNEKLNRYKREQRQLEAKLGGGGGGATGIRLSRYESLKRDKKNIEQEIAEAQALIADNGRKAMSLERANRNISQLEDQQDRLQKEVNALDIEAFAPTRVEIVEDANVPEVKNVKTRTRLAAIGAMGMFALVIAAFTLFEWMAQRLSSPDELTSETGLRLLGSLPAPERPGMLGKLGFGEPNLNEWNRVLVESVDVVRTYLLRHLKDDGPKAIVIASASANEGKTTLSTQLGSSIARSGRRVCVVDCDFRRPSAHLVFQTEQGMGISELLRGEADVDTITRETSIPGLCFISAGQVDDESLRILSMDGGETLVETLRKHFDYVIIDTSPILFVAEPSMLAQYSDGVVVAVRRDYSRLGFVNQACETLRNLDAPVVGTVMVGAESSIHRQTYGYQQDIRFAEPQQKRAPNQQQKTAV
jgi:capsular exopolysaccharide synthesis family protein